MQQKGCQDYLVKLQHTAWQDSSGLPSGSESIKTCIPLVSNISFGATPSAIVTIRFLGTSN